MFSFRALLFIGILLVYLIAGGLYAGLTPKWQAPDEPAHYNYVRYLATKPGFPELVRDCYNQTYLDELTSRRFPPELAVDNVCYEFHQPPLYYLLSLPIFVLSGGSLGALRLFSVILGAGVVALAFFMGRTIFPNRPEIAYGSMAFVAFIPMHLAILASVNNDALAELVLAAILFVLVRQLTLAASTSTPPNDSRRPAAGGPLLLGALLGIGLLTKMTVYIALPLIAVTLWWTSIYETERRSPDQAKRGGARIDWRRLWGQATIIYGLALVIALPWYIRNAILYGNFDILGLARHDSVVVGQPRTADFLAEAGWGAYISNFMTTTFNSFWGQFGWMAVPMDQRTYQLLSLLTLIALAGLIKFQRKSFSPHYLISAGQRQALSLMGLTIALMALAYGWYNLTFTQFQGRYLFPALIPLGLFFSLGLSEAFTRRWVWWLVVALGGALIWLGTVSMLNGGLDKWAMLIIGLAWAIALGRALLVRHWLIPNSWLVAACYGGLALLAVLGPFWFVIPYLSL